MTFTYSNVVFEDIEFLNNGGVKKIKIRGNIPTSGNVTHYPSPDPNGYYVHDYDTAAFSIETNIGSNIIQLVQYASAGLPSNLPAKFEMTTDFKSIPGKGNLSIGFKRSVGGRLQFVIGVTDDRIQYEPNSGGEFDFVIYSAASDTDTIYR